MDAFLNGYAWEVKLIEWFQSNLGGFGITLAKIFTQFGSEIVVVGILVVCYLCINKKLGEKIITTVIMSLAFGSIFKNLLLRMRPYFSHSSIKCLSPVDSKADIYDISAQGYSFPSLHSANSVSAFSSPYAFTKKKALLPLAIIAPLLVGISRFVLGCHYPTDVMFGWLQGIVLIIIVDLSFRKLKKSTRYIVLGLLAMTGCFICKSNDYYSALGLILGFFSGNLYEERHSNFTDTDSILSKILRVAGAGVIFFVMDLLLKLPFSNEFLASATTAQYIFRTLRYAVIIFVIVGIYPRVFKYYDSIKLDKEKAHRD